MTNYLQRYFLIGALVGIIVGTPLFWIAPTWLAVLAFWSPIVIGVVVAFIRQSSRNYGYPMSPAMEAAVFREVDRALLRREFP